MWDIGNGLEFDQSHVQTDKRPKKKYWNILFYFHCPLLSLYPAWLQQNESYIFTKKCPGY